MLQIKSLRTKLIVCFVLITLIPLGVTGLYGHFFTSRALSQQILERSMQQVHLQAESVVNALWQAQGDTLYLSALRSLNTLRRQTTPENIALWQREVAQDLLVLAASRHMYHGVRLINSEGMETIAVRADDTQVKIVNDLQNRRDVLYFRATMAQPVGGLYVSPFEAQDEHGAPYIHYAARLPDGVVVIDLHAGWLLRSLPATASSDTWMMIDQDGRFLVYPEGFEPLSASDDIPRMLDGGSGSIETANYVYVYDTIYPVIDSRAETKPDQFWVLIRRTPTPVLYASANDFYRLASTFAGATAIIAIGFAVLTSRWLTEPIKTLTGLTAQFGMDGIPPELPANLPGDEIGVLTHTFTDMAHELARKRKQEHRLIEQLISAQEEERKLVAYDLHDGLIQQMVGARFYLSNCRDICPVHAPKAREGIQRGCDALTNAITEGRRIIEGLRPATLDDLGLTAAIEEIAHDTAVAAGWTLTLDIHPLPTEPEMTVAVTLYRIAQEALNNIRKHAQASHVRLSLHNGKGIFLNIQDDGIGFDPVMQAGSDHGLGITTMQERAALINGTCNIHSYPGQGTEIEVTVPLTIAVTKLEKEVV